MKLTLRRCLEYSCNDQCNVKKGSFNVHQTYGSAILCEVSATHIFVHEPDGVREGFHELVLLEMEGLDRLLAQIDEQLALSGLERGESVGH